MNQNTIPLPDEGDPDPDIHGKLAHLNAVDIRSLSLSARYAYITLLHPPNSDELGRFMTNSGALPSLTALSDKQARAAIVALEGAGLLRRWEHGGSLCYELGGGYAFKPDLKKQLSERRKIANQKREEIAKRRQRKKDADEGVPFAYEDDGTEVEGKVHEKIRTQRGNLIPRRSGVYFNSKVPPPKGKQRHKMLIEQPDKTEGCVLRMLPSFNPGVDLGALGAVLRFYLLMECDDYGRVVVDVGRLHQQLGPAITKRVSKADIEAELAEMERLGHLKVFEKRKGKFAYLRDSAQHMKTKKYYSRNIPRLLDASNYTYDSADYAAFFEACAKHSASRTTVRVGQFSERGDVISVSEHVKLAARRFLKGYEEMMAEEPYCSYSAAQIMDRESVPNTSQSVSCDYAFWYAATTNQPAEWIAQHYLRYREQLDGGAGGEADAKIHKILTYLLKMTPAEFVDKAQTDDQRPAVADPREAPNRVPCEQDEPPAVPHDEEESPVVPHDEDAPPVVPPDDEEVPPIVPGDGDESHSGGA